MKMDQQKKKKILRIIVGLIGFILAFSITFVIIKNMNKEEKVEEQAEANTNENVVKEQEVDGLTFSNTALITENGESKLTTEVRNTTDNDIELKSFDIIVKGEDGKEIVTLLGYVGETIKAGETKSMISSTNHDLTSATEIEYKINY